MIGSENKLNEKVTVGQEFIEWAEKYWLLDKLVKTGNSTEENFNYDYMKNVFIDKINSLIIGRL